MRTIFATTLALAIFLSACTQPVPTSQEKLSTVPVESKIATDKDGVIAKEKSEKSKDSEFQGEEIEIVKYDGTTKKITDSPSVQISDYFTELSPQISIFNSEKGNCKRIKSASQASYGEVAEINEDAFKKEFEGKIDSDSINQFISATKEVLKEKQAFILSHLCKTETEIYLTFWDEKYLYIALWNGEKFKTQKTLGVGKSDYTFVFVPNYFANKHLLGSGAGDAGMSSWSFANFDFGTGAINYIEICDATNKFKEYVGFTNVINVQCEMEYSSTRGIIKYDEYQFDKCKNRQDSDERNECFSALAEHDFTNYRNSKLEPANICGLISDNEQKDKCFWGYAMKSKNEDLCDKIITSNEKINTKDCKQEINYTTQGANWKLDSGITYVTDSRLYKGYGAFSGWIIEEKNEYNSSKIFFHVSDESLDNLPTSLRQFRDAELTIWLSERDFRNVSSSGDLPEYLKTSTEENPITIEVIGIVSQENRIDFWLKE